MIWKLLPFTGWHRNDMIMSCLWNCPFPLFSPSHIFLCFKTWNNFKLKSFKQKKKICSFFFRLKWEGGRQTEIFNFSHLCVFISTVPYFVMSRLLSSFVLFFFSFISSPFHFFFIYLFFLFLLLILSLSFSNIKSHCQWAVFFFLLCWKCLGKCL